MITTSLIAPPQTPAWYVGDLFLDRDALRTERLQCEDEGREIAHLLDEFHRLEQEDLSSQAGQFAARELLDRTAGAPYRSDYPYHEPSDLEGIRAALPAAHPVGAPPPSGEHMRDKLLGAWLGRCCGCLLGKPIECWHSDRVWPMLQGTANWPLSRYMEGNQPDEIRERFDIHPGTWGDQVQHMPEDDDLNYTVMALEVMKNCGPGFSTDDVARHWLKHLPVDHTFTAERVAYRNLLMLTPPPLTATFRNPYREWIGAQIRSDFYGYAAPGLPDVAAEWAWRDASLSHVKNGIYGAMWVAAMTSTAAVIDDITAIIESGLAQIPANCRLSHAIREIMHSHRDGARHEDMVRQVHQRWDEKNKHDWCHTISNAQIVAIGLLWGEGLLGTSICRAVQPCFDTDCNGATVGSIIGMIRGAGNLNAQEWTAPLNDTLITGIAGRNRVSISRLAEESAALVEQLWPA